MKNIISGSFFAISVLFMLTISATLCAQPLYKEKLISASNIENSNNFVGEIWAQHGSPLTGEMFIKNIWNGGVFKPVDESNRDFYFPEHNGSVLMNFTLNLSHRLSWPMFLSRQTKFAIWVQSQQGFDPTIVYLRNNTIIPCDNISWSTFNWTVFAFDKVETEGKSVNLTVYFYVSAIIAGFIPTYHWGAYDWIIKLPFISPPPGCMFDITIHPT